MRSDIDNWDALLLRLKHALQALATSADSQLDLFPEFVCKVDELALNFDHWNRCVLSNDESALTNEQKSLLSQLDCILTEMSNRGNQSLWTETALRDNAEWESVRDMAKATLASFTWSVECPPSYKHEYVSGESIQRT
jgi:hypothetical protein